MDNEAKSKSQLLEEVAALRQENEALNRRIIRREAELAVTEKMAALGQLLAGIAHEINTPLGAISASIDNITSALDETLRQLPQLFQQLSPEQQRDFFALVDTALQNRHTLNSREERKLKRALRRDLEERGIDQADLVADILVEIGLYEDFEPFMPLVQAENVAFIMQAAYNLVSQQTNNRNIKTAVERAAKIVFALRSYARHDHSGEMVEANLSEGLDTVLTLYHNQLKHGVEVIKHYEDVPPIYCYPDELNQVWTNLIHNALQAMENKGQLEIVISKLVISNLDKDTTSSRDDPSSIANYQLAISNYLSVSITDSGPGIPDEIKERIFQPFFTTKPVGEGSGLGLDIVRKIVDKHQGKIELDSKPGRTTFRVLLPLT